MWPWQKFKPAASIVAGPGLLLECGHVSDPIERLRVGDEKWCPTCAAWRLESK